MTSTRFALLSAVLLAAVFHISARNLPPREALDRAMQSGALRAEGRPAGLESMADTEEYTLAHTSESGTYYVFNRSTGGYIVVSADDGALALLADVQSGTFSPDTMPPATAWMLGEYDRQIQSLSTDEAGKARRTRARSAEESATDLGLADYYNRWSEVPPLMTTQWNQLYPYNIYCPVTGGKTCVTGCVATAMAQVVRTIGYYQGSGRKTSLYQDAHGENISFDYATATFDFNSMFDTFPSSAATTESIDQVGRLMLACGLSVNMGYGVSGSGAQSEDVPLALVDYFGYDSEYTKIYSNEDFSQAQWENMLYGQLNVGRPVYYSGVGVPLSHAFVIDGYRPVGMYHVNWGWGGMSDGYFRLSALNPSQIGTGGGTGGYSLGQRMVCAVPPGADPGVVYGYMNGSITVVSEGVYAVYYKSNGKNLFGTDIGAVITDNNGNILAEATFWKGQNITASSALRHDAYTYDFSVHTALTAGEYRIYPAFKTEGGDYTIADEIYNKQHFAILTVTEDNRYITSNPPGISFETDMHVAGIAPGYDLRAGTSGAISFYVVNNGNLDYNGKFSITLLNSNSEEIASYSSKKVIVAAGANTFVYCSVPVFDTSGARIPPGNYPVRFTDNDGNVISDAQYSIEIKSGTPLDQWEADEGIEVTNCSSMPQTMLSGSLWTHTPLIHNKSQTFRNVTLQLAFYPVAEVTPTITYTLYRGNIDIMQQLFPVEPLSLDVHFGTYEVCYRKGYGQISQRRPIRIGTSVDGIAYYPAYTTNGISAILHDKKQAPKIIRIPGKVKIEGTARNVTEIETEAFMTADGISVIDLPASIANIGFNAFTACPSLRQIILRSEQPPFSLRNSIAPGLDPSTEFYVTASAYDKYKPLLEGFNPLYTLLENIESKEVTASTTATTNVSLALTPAHQAINPAFTIIPADDSSAQIAEVTVETLQSGSLTLAIKALKTGTATFHVYPAHSTDKHAVLTVNVPIEKPMFSIPSGIYIIGQNLNISSPEGTTIAYTVNDAPEVETTANTVDYRFPHPGTYRLKARTITPTGNGKGEWTDNLSYDITENIVRLPGEKSYYPLTLSPLGISTFAALQNYIMPDGLQGGTVTLDEAKGEATVTYNYKAGYVVPAKTALVLKATDEPASDTENRQEYHLLLTDREGNTPVGNRLLPALTYERIESESGTKLYILADDPIRGLGFFFQGKDSDGSAVEGIYGKGYLAADATAEIRAFILKDELTTDTGNTTAHPDTMTDTEVYTLSGIRIHLPFDSLPAGIYIVNGRRMIVR